MRPFTVILGILLGSLVAMAFGLTVVALVFWLPQGEYEQFAAEMPALLTSTAMFTGLAAVCGVAFYATVTRRRWRHAVLSLFWLALFATGWYYWPS